MRIAITGASGMVGSALIATLEAGGHESVRIVRGGTSTGPGALRWDPTRGEIDARGLEGLDAVIHLAGENIGAGRWSPARKAAIRDSRVQGTGLLARTLGRLARPPRVLVSASAIGFYGDRGGEALTEESPAGTGFLAEVCRAWEAAAAPAAEQGIRVASVRIGVVLSSSGGALARMLPLFRFGLGGVLGSGEQWMSWVALDDLVQILLRVVAKDGLRGPVNAVAPNPVTNRELTKVLGRALGRPTLLAVPAPLLRMGLGEMAGPLLLSSAKVLPARLTASGYMFRFPDLEGTLRHLLGRTGAASRLDDVT